MDSKQGNRSPDDRRENVEQERSFGRRVRELRKERLESDPSFTLRQFAEKIGVSPSYLSMVENGTTSIRAALAKRIAEALGADVDKLMGLGGQIDPELKNIVLSRPAIPAFLRSIDGLSDEQIARVCDYARFQASSPAKDGK